MGKKEIIRMINGFIKKAQKEIAINKVILFGSQASNTTHKDSDIDLIIVSPDFESMSAIQRAAKLYNYWEALYPVDFICYTPKEFNILKRRITIVKEALSKGIIVV
ncbi:MAG: nucleotidyltransferase domain-containing protein [Candidatus Pacearchaeota archaeon]|nr:nucleotidyltransferase domain-containing protein [Candidatus Pacearchaeota archaeon]